MALNERLAIIVDAATSGAVRGLKDVAKASADLDGATGKTAAQMKILEARSLAASQTLRTGLSVAAGVAGGALIAGFAAASSAAMGFDKSMSGVAAVADATAGEMGQLRDAALAAGKATVFSASEAATAEAELAKAGVSVKDILGGGLVGALDLASAGQLALADAATIAAQALNIFDLSGDQTTRVADVLAAAANKSAADVGQLGDALRQGGLVAEQSGLSLEDTAGVLALFADNALIGSDAGTSLKTMLMRLVPSSNEAQAAIDELGLSFFDGSGQMRNIADIAGELQTKMAGLSQQQRAAAMNTIFGSDATRAANVLFKEGAAGVREYSDAVDDQGAAARMAATQTDNLAGDLDRLKGSIETALIQGGSGGTSALRFLAQGAEGAVSAFAGLPAPIQAGAAGLAGLSGVVLTAGAAVAFLGPKIADARTALEGLGAAGKTASAGIGGIGRAAGGLGAIAALAVGLDLLSDKVSELQNGKVNLTEMASAVVDLGTSGKMSGELVKQFGDNLDDLGKSFRLTSVSRDAKKDIAALDDSLAELVRSDNAGLAAEAFNKIAEAAKRQGVPIEDVRKRLGGYRDALTEVRTSSKLAASAQEKVQTTSEYLAASLKRVQEAAADAATGLSKTQLLESLSKQIDVTSGGLLAQARTLGGSFIVALTSGMDEKSADNVRKGFEKIGEAISSSLDASEAWAKLEAEGKASIGALTKALEGQIEDLRSWQTNLVAIAARGGEEMAAALLEKGPGQAGFVAKIIASSESEFSALAGHYKLQGELSGGEFAAGVSFKIRAAAAIAKASGTQSAVQIAAGLVGGLQFATPAVVAQVTEIARVAGLALAASPPTISPALSTEAFNRDFARFAAGLLKDSFPGPTIVPQGPKGPQGPAGPAKKGGSSGGKRAELADGGVLTRFANGGEHHVAQIARAGEMRLWAEPETGGEAYIPLAASKRSRSQQILLNVARRFGMHRFADGGYTGWTNNPDGSPSHPRNQDPDFIENDRNSANRGKPGYHQVEDGSWVNWGADSPRDTTPVPYRPTSGGIQRSSGSSAIEMRNTFTINVVASRTADGKLDARSIVDALTAFFRNGGGKPDWVK